MNRTPTTVISAPTFVSVTAAGEAISAITIKIEVFLDEII